MKKQNDDELGSQMSALPNAPYRGWTYFGLAEATLLFAGILAANHWLLDGRINDITPHLFWLPVLLISFQHGLFSGIVTAVTAAGLAQYIGWAPQAGSEDYYQYLLRVWSYPALWLGAAIVLGAMRQHLIGERNLAQEKIRGLENERRVIADHCRTVQGELAGLEHKIAAHTPQKNTDTFEIFDRIALMTAQTIEQELPAIMVTLFGPLTFSLYGFGERGSRAVLARASNEANLPSGRHIPLSDRFHHMLAAHGRGLSVLEPGDMRVLADNGLFAAALKNSRTGRVIGALKIDMIEQENITPKTGQLFRMVCAELGDVMAERGIGSDGAHTPGPMWPRLVRDELPADTQ